MSSAMHLSEVTSYEQPVLEKYTENPSRKVALRIYSSTHPNNLKIANLQKGLVFVHNGIEQIGEGGGFGLPILKFGDETFFSGSSTVTVTRNGCSTRVHKDFLMDRIARRKFRNVHLQNRIARAFMKQANVLYQKYSQPRILALRELSLNMGLESVFVKTSPVGELAVTYEISDNVIDVKVDCTRLNKKHLQKIFILNEQSASFFRMYSDATSEKMLDGRIGAWHAINSEWACLLNPHYKIGYRLWDVEKSVLWRGREMLKSYLDWTGLDYELSPYENSFEYKIELLGVPS
jgi:hypothetical protein